MSRGGNADTENGEMKMEKEESVRTMECLRGRLLAERAASRNAKEEAQQLENKMMELENLLKQEAKSRNRAEKKLKSLIQKLESINISYPSDESQHSESKDKSDISSTTSTTSSTIKEQHNTKILETQGSEENLIPQNESKNSQQNESRNCSSSLSDDSSTIGGSSISAFEVNSSNAADLEHSDKSSSKLDQQSDTCYHSIKSSTDEGLKKEDDQDSDGQVDDSMALVLVDSPKKDRPVDPEVLDATVKEVLDVLRNAKEQLQSSMERRRMNMIRVG